MHTKFNTFGEIRSFSIKFRKNAKNILYLHCLFFFFERETRSCCVAQAGLELELPAILSPSAGIKDLCHHVQSLLFFNTVAQVLTEVNHIHTEKEEIKLLIHTRYQDHLWRKSERVKDNRSLEPPSKDNKLNTTKLVYNKQSNTSLYSSNEKMELII